MGEYSKTCAVCGKAKPLAAYSRRRNSRIRSARCRECVERAKEEADLWAQERFTGRRLAAWITEMDRRIAAARRFKAATGGAYVDDAALERALELPQ